MNRRDFLRYLGAVGAILAFEKSSAHANWLAKTKDGTLPKGMLVVDAHAHPDQFYYVNDKVVIDESSTLEKIKTLGMHGSSFSAVGDSSTQPFTFTWVMAELNSVINLEEQDMVRIIRRYKDMPHGSPPKGFVPGAILSLEGASPIGSDFGTASSNLDLLYELGVRMITVMHYLDNPFGESMRRSHPGKAGTGLTDLGELVVERMMSLGMIVDVAHAHYATLKDITAIATAGGVPVIDSHTSLSPASEPNGGRLRTWEEMEMVAATGGLVCTWPLKWEDQNTGSGRFTLLDWAEENYEMKQRLGSGHIALGTDGGGVLPGMVDGYSSILDLPALIDAMYAVGFKRSEINDYMGKNLLRVLKECVG